MTDTLFGSGEAVTLVTTFRLRADARPERFVELWSEVGRLMARRRGFQRAALHRPLIGGEEDVTFIQVSEWNNAALLSDARSDPEIRAVEGMIDREGLLADTRRVLCAQVVPTLVPPTP